MEIKELTIDAAEMREAVQMFLGRRGISAPVEDVRRAWDDGYKVTLDLKPKSEPPARLSPEAAKEALDVILAEIVHEQKEDVRTTFDQMA